MLGHGGNQRSEGEGGLESEGEVRGGSGRWRGTRGGVQALDGEQELARRVPAHHGHALILLARRKMIGGGQWAGPLGGPANWAATDKPGKSFSSLLFLFSFIL